MATISESNGRASVFLGAVSAGLIALVFESTRGAGPVGRMIFQVLVLTPLVFLGLSTTAAFKRGRASSCKARPAQLGRW